MTGTTSSRPMPTSWSRRTSGSAGSRSSLQDKAPKLIKDSRGRRRLALRRRHRARPDRPHRHAGHAVGPVPVEGRHLRRGPRRLLRRAPPVWRTWTSTASTPRSCSRRSARSATSSATTTTTSVLAGIEAYNNFLFEEFCAPEPRPPRSAWPRSRSIGIDAAVDALRKAKARGAKGVVISYWPVRRRRHLRRRRRVLGRGRRTRGCPSAIHINLDLPRGPPAARQAAAQTGRSQSTAGHGRQGRRQGRRRPGRRLLHRARHDRPADLHRRVRALPRPAHLDDRDRRGLDAALPRADRRPLLAQPLVGRHPDRRAAVVLLVPQHVAPRSSCDRTGIAQPPRGRGRQHDVVDGLSAPRQRLAALPQGHQRDDGRPARRRDGTRSCAGNAVRIFKLDRSKLEGERS